MLLDARGLEAGYGHAKVLFGVSLQIDEGEVVTLIGRNGMGKTTTIRALIGLVRPTAGEIEFAGARVEKAPPHRIARLGFGLVPEGRQIFPNLSVRENLVMAGIERGHGGEPWTLERVLDFISAALADGGEFWSIGEAIGRNGNRLWGRAQDAANACFTSLPARLRRNHHTGVVDERLPDDDYGSGTFEGIRSQDILPLLTDRLDPVDVYRRNCFLWRLVNQAYNGNYDMSDPEDVARLQGFVLAELAHFRDGGRPTELHGVFRKRLL